MVIGIDVGGTKTEAVLFDEAGKVVKKKVLESAHPSCATTEKMKDILKQCLLDEPSEIVIGYAGYGKSKRMREMIEETVSSVFEERKYVLLNDIELALWSHLGDRDGIVLILGTGSIVLKRKNNVLTRAGGWGYLLGDEGSGYAVGRDILRKFVLQADGRKKKTELYERLMKLYDIRNSSEILDKVMQNGNVNRTEVAKCAVLSTMEENRSILTDQAKQAAELVNFIREDDLEVVVTGGMSRNSVYMDILKEYLPGMNISRVEPVYGAYLYSKNN